jgi:trehalose-6-phosphate synthase
MATPLINVSNRLPVTIKDGEVKPSSGGLVAALEGLPKQQFQATWIGWPGAAFGGDQQYAIAQKLSEEYGCVPVFLSEEEGTGFYEGFSNSSLWPVLHYLPNFLRYEPAW